MYYPKKKTVLVVDEIALLANDAFLDFGQLLVFFCQAKHQCPLFELFKIQHPGYVSFL